MHSEATTTEAALPGREKRQETLTAPLHKTIETSIRPTTHGSIVIPSQALFGAAGMRHRLCADEFHSPARRRRVPFGSTLFVVGIQKPLVWRRVAGFDADGCHPGIPPRHPTSPAPDGAWLSAPCPPPSAWSIGTTMLLLSDAPSTFALVAFRLPRKKIPGTISSDPKAATCPN